MKDRLSKGEIRTTIDIKAPRDVVWSVLVDLASYAQWNPFVRKASGTIALGERLILEPVLPGRRRAMRFEAEVTTCRPREIFAWTGIVVHEAISAGEHIFRLEDAPGGKTRLHHDEVFSGLVTPLVMIVGARATRKGFEMMNEATKKRAETQCQA